MGLKATRSALRQRWSSDSGRDLALLVQRRITAGEPLDGLGLPQVGGRVDLRGLPFLTSLSRLRGVSLVGVDLSQSSLGAMRLTDCTVTDCVVDGADCQFWHVERSSFADCTFVRADLRHSRLGIWQDGGGNTFSGVDFTRADFRHCDTSAATYRDCDFSSARLDRVNFWQSSLIRCTFAGPVQGVIFDGRFLGEEKPDANPMDHVDFTGAVIDACDFRGVRFDAISLPDDPDLILLRDRAVVDRAAAALHGVGDDPDAAAAGLILGSVRDGFGMGGEVLLNLRDFTAGTDLARTLLLRAPGQRAPR